MYVKTKCYNKTIQWQDDSIDQQTKTYDAHLQPLTNVPTEYQLPTPYSFRDKAGTRFYRSRSLWQGKIKVTP